MIPRRHRAGEVGIPGHPVPSVIRPDGTPDGIRENQGTRAERSEHSRGEPQPVRARRRRSARPEAPCGCRRVVLARLRRQRGGPSAESRAGSHRGSRQARPISLNPWVPTRKVTWSTCTRWAITGTWFPPAGDQQHHRAPASTPNVARCCAGSCSCCTPGSAGSFRQELGFGSGMTCWRRLRDWNKAEPWQQCLHELLLRELRAADQPRARPRPSPHPPARPPPSRTHAPPPGPQHARNPLPVPEAQASRKVHSGTWPTDIPGRLSEHDREVTDIFRWIWSQESGLGPEVLPGGTGRPLEASRR